MRRLRKSFAAAAACAAWLAAPAVPPAVAAEPISFSISADVRFTMELPRGLCHIDPAGDDADKIYIKGMSKLLQPENLLLAAFADCRSLEQMRKDFAANGDVKSLARWMQVMTPQLGGGAPQKMPSGMARTEAIELLGRAAGNDPSVDVSLAVRQLSQAPADKDVEPKNIGTLARDKVALYSGVMTREVDDGKIRLIGGVQAMTVVGAYALSVNDFRTYQGRDSLDAGVADTREIVRGLIARNEK